MASQKHRHPDPTGPTPPAKTSNIHAGTSSVPKLNCWQRLLQKMSGKSSQIHTGMNMPVQKQQIAGGNPELNNKISNEPVPDLPYQKAVVQPASLGFEDKAKKTQEISISAYQDSKVKPVGSPNPGQSSENKKMDPKLPEALGRFEHDAKTKPVGSLQPGHSLPNKQETSYTSPAEKISENLGVGDKKMDSKLQGTEGSSAQDAKAKTGSSHEPGQLVQNKPRSSHGSSTVKSNVIAEVGDKKSDSKLTEALCSSDQDDKMKPVGSLQADQLLSNKYENNGIPGVRDKNLDSQLPITLGSLVQEAKTKTGSSPKPSHLFPNKQENSYGHPSERSSGIPGVGNDKMDSKLSKALGSSDRDTITKPARSLEPGHLLPNKQENSHASPEEKIKGSPGVGEKKIDSKLLETLGSSYQDAKEKTGSSPKPVHLSQKKQENSHGIPSEKSSGTHGVGDKKVDSKLPEALRKSDQDAKTKTASSAKPGHLLQIDQGNRGPEKLVRKSPPKAVRQEEINELGEYKDPKPQKETINGFERSSEEQRKAYLKPENNSESKTKKFNGSTEQAGLLPRNEKGKEVVKQPSFRNKDNIYIDTSHLETTESIIGYTISEQQKGAPKLENEKETQINRRPSSPVKTNFSSLGEQFLFKEQQKSVAKPEGINKNDKNTAPIYAGCTGHASKQQQTVVPKQDSSYEIHRNAKPDPTKFTIGGSGQQAAGIKLSNQPKGNSQAGRYLYEYGL